MKFWTSAVIEAAAAIVFARPFLAGAAVGTLVAPTWRHSSRCTRAALRLAGSLA